MADEIQPASSNLLRNVLFAVVAAYLLFSLYFAFQLKSRIDSLEARQAKSEQELAAQIHATESRVSEVHATFSQKVGETEKEIQQRTAELKRAQKQTESRLSEEQLKQQQALGAVTGDVAGVRSEVGGVKSDVAATRTDLEATKAKLERAIGDLGIQSGLIATTREDLEVLKHKGDRNYYDFVLQKNKKQPISTITLELKKADTKRGKYTMNVFSDDHKIEKKDRTMNEPVQFYSGKDHLLYELVVFTVEKNRVTGYLSTPKNAPVPISR